MGFIVIQILILLIVWLMSCAVCALVGFFVGVKGWFKADRKNVVQSEAEVISEAERHKREREALEYQNMMTYDGTPQRPIDIK